MSENSTNLTGKPGSPASHLGRNASTMNGHTGNGTHAWNRPEAAEPRRTQPTQDTPKSSNGMWMDAATRTWKLCFFGVTMECIYKAPRCFGVFQISWLENGPWRCICWENAGRECLVGLASRPPQYGNQARTHTHRHKLTRHKLTKSIYTFTTDL